VPRARRKTTGVNQKSNVLLTPLTDKPFYALNVLSETEILARLNKRKYACDKNGKVPDPPNLTGLRLGNKIAHHHVFDHAPAQRAYCLIDHGHAPVLIEVANPSSSRQDVSRPR
jgi:hypothetical protein